MQLDAAPVPRPRRVTRRFVASIGLAIGPAPARVRLWRAGPNPWDGGVVNLTPRALDAVLGEYERRGNPLSMDIEHQISIAEQQARARGELAPEEPIVTAGYCALERVDTPEGPELWFVPRWSDCGRDAPVPEKVCCAKHQIESGQRCEFSPDWEGDPETGEPIRVNRISLVLDGATHAINLLASRAAVRRNMASEMDGCRAAYAWHKAMAAAGGDDAKTHEDMAAKLQASAASLGVDLEKGGDGPKPEPDGDEPVVKGATAAEPVPTPKGPEDQLPKPAMGAAAPAMASKPIAPTAQPLTMAGVLRELNERDALRDLLDINKDRIPEKHRTMLASRGLAAAREYVEGLPPRPAPAGTNGDVGAAPDGKVRPWRKSLNAAEQFMANRIRTALGKTEKDEEEFDKRVDDDGGITCSIVEIVERNKAHRLARAQNRGAA